MSDLSTMIVDLLRSSTENKALNAGGPIAKAEAPAPSGDSAISAGAQSLMNPGYIAYKREALANGELVMSPEEFKQAQGSY